MPRLLALALLLACSPAAAQRKPKPPAKPAAKPGPDRPSQLPLTAPVVTVNGEKIPISTFIDRLSVEFAPQIREALIEEALIKQEAKTRGITATTPEIDAVVARVYGGSLRQYGDEKNLAKQLKDTRGWSIQDYKAVIRARAGIQVLREKLIASLVKATEVTDKDVADRYEQRKMSFYLGDSVRISHILVRRPFNGDATLDAAARAKAEDLLKKAKAPGADFAGLAQQSSEDEKTAKDGGKVPQEIMKASHPFGAAFEAAVFPAEPGIIDQVIATPLGFHVVRLDSKQAARQVPLEEVKGQLRESLLAERRGQKMDELYLKLRGNANVETGRF
jgi:parvulin-like peptidyl-prolyl isomerase